MLVYVGVKDFHSFLFKVMKVFFVPVIYLIYLYSLSKELLNILISKIREYVFILMKLCVILISNS